MFSTVKNACCSPTGPWIHRLRSRIRRNAKPKYPSESSDRLELDFWRWSYGVLLFLLADIKAAIEEAPSRCACNLDAPSCCTCNRDAPSRCTCGYTCVKHFWISLALESARPALAATSRILDDIKDDCASVVVSRLVKKPIGDVNLIRRTLSILRNHTLSLHGRLVLISKVDNFFSIPPKGITFQLDTTKELLQCLSAMQFEDDGDMSSEEDEDLGGPSDAKRPHLDSSTLESLGRTPSILGDHILKTNRLINALKEVDSLSSFLLCSANDWGFNSTHRNLCRCCYCWYYVNPMSVYLSQ